MPDFGCCSGKPKARCKPTARELNDCADRKEAAKREQRADEHAARAADGIRVARAFGVKPKDVLKVELPFRKGATEPVR
jgi:hypothetical protein